MMGAAWLGLAGVIVGVAGTLAVTWMTTRTATQQAREARQAARFDSIRERAVEGYLAAVEAVGWLSSMHVEDSVDPRFEPEYGPKTALALEKLEDARSALGRVAGLGGSAVLTEVAQETFSALSVLGDAWQQAQHYRRSIVAGGGDFSRKSFDHQYKRLDLVRERLCGMAAELPYKELDQGRVLAGSLLYRLRQATSAV
jgi:hypothetical protein